MKVGRFQVMATLQAARAYILGLPLESALSWGLNRSIFYAAAKRGFKGGPGVKGKGAKGKERARARARDKLADMTEGYTWEQIWPPSPMPRFWLRSRNM